MKFTFKKDTGVKWDKNNSCTIKLKKKKVGSIIGNTSDGFMVRFMVIKDDILDDGNENCPWKWVVLSNFYHRHIPIIFPTINQAKFFINFHIESIMEKYNLHMMED